MKSFKKSVSLILLSMLHSISITMAQGILIDSSYTADVEIFTIENIESVTGLLMTGGIDLNNDTSLVRIIVIDGTGAECFFHFLVFHGCEVLSCRFF